MRVLVDTSVWIDYFRTGDHSDDLDDLIDNNLVFTNDLILTELIPFLRLKQQSSIIKAIQNIAVLSLSLNWREIQEFQLNCLKAGINGVTIPDLIIVQNALQHASHLYTLDKHFRLMQDVLNFTIYG